MMRMQCRANRCLVAVTLCVGSSDSPHNAERTTAHLMAQTGISMPARIAAFPVVAQWAVLAAPAVAQDGVTSSRPAAFRGEPRRPGRFLCRLGDEAAHSFSS